MQSELRVEFIGFVGRKGQPLLIQKFTGESSELDVSCLVYTSLDDIDLRLQDASKGYDEFLGLINYIENLNIYGYVTNSRLKMIAGVRWLGFEPKDPIIKAMFVKLHDEYVGLVTNPIYKIDEPIPTDSRFAQRVKAIGLSYLSD